MCERVRVRGGGPQIYFVMKVDEEASTVDLIPVSGRARGLDDVPFSELVRTPADVLGPEC